MYVIEMNESQAQVLKDALDFYERVLGLGQLEEIEYHWRWYADIRAEDFQQKSDTLRYSLYAAKSVGWGHSPNSSRSIRSQEVPKKFRIAYDMTQVLRKAMSDVRLAEAKEEGDEDLVQHLKMTVDQNEYWSVEPEVPPMKVKHIFEQT